MKYLYRKTMALFIDNLLEHKSALEKVGAFLAQASQNRISQWGVGEGETEKDEGSFTVETQPLSSLGL